MKTLAEIVDFLRGGGVVSIDEWKAFDEQTRTAFRECVREVWRERIAQALDDVLHPQGETEEAPGALEDAASKAAGTYPGAPA